MKFPRSLYHGTSSHYLDAFRTGERIRPWPLREPALGLLRETWEQLSAFGVEPEFWAREALAQSSERSNWQHGEVYVTANLRRAAMYARTAADYGGELLSMCRLSLDELAKRDRARSNALQERFVRLKPFLIGGGQPIVVEFVDVLITDLTNEVGPEPASEKVNLLVESNFDEVFTQVINFRLRPESTRVHQRFTIKLDDPDDSRVSAFELVECP